jgi:hypothetical protein
LQKANQRVVGHVLWAPTGALIVALFLVSLGRTRLLEAKRRNASLLMIRDTRLYKSALELFTRVLKAKKPQERAKLAAELTSFVPELDLGTSEQSRPR